MKENSLLTIITPVKNGEKTIEKTIKSIVLQNDPFVEYIIVDGVSNDKTLDIIKKYEKNINKLVSEPDKNLYDAINKGISLANGEVIGICLSGDDYKPGAFKIAREYFKKTPNADFFFGTIIRNYTGGTIVKQGFNRKRILYNFDSQTSISSGFFITSSAQKKVGKYDTNFSISSDYDFFYRLMIKNNLLGVSSKKSEIIGEMASGGLSSKMSFLGHLKEQTKIRLKHKQYFMIIPIIINAILKNIPTIARDLKKNL